MTEGPQTQQEAIAGEGDPPAWSAKDAWSRLFAQEPSTEIDDAFFWWKDLGDRLNDKAASAVFHLQKIGRIPEQYAWLRQESLADLYDLSAEEYAEVGHAYIAGLTDAQRGEPMNAARAAAEYLVLYAQLVELTDDFAGTRGEAPCPLRPVEAARCMKMCALLGAYGEAFDPGRGGVDLSLARRKGGAVRAARADERWRLPVLEMARVIRAAHPPWGDEAVAKYIFDNPPPGLAAPLTVEKVRRQLASWGRNQILVRSTSYAPTRSPGQS